MALKSISKNNENQCSNDGKCDSDDLLQVKKVGRNLTAGTPFHSTTSYQINQPTKTKASFFVYCLQIYFSVFRLVKSYFTKNMSERKVLNVSFNSSFIL